MNVRIRFTAFSPAPNETKWPKIQSRFYGLFLIFYEKALNAESFPRISLSIRIYFWYFHILSFGKYGNILGKYYGQVTEVISQICLKFNLV